MSPFYKPWNHQKTKGFLFLRDIDIAWKLSKYGVFSGPYSVLLRENMDQKKTPYLDTFHAI